MPNKKKKHNRHGKSKGKAAGPGAAPAGSQKGDASTASATAAPGATSQPKQTTPTPSAQVSTMKPAEFEKHDVDPFEALADSLPSSDPLVPTAPVFTGPEVKEHDITSEKGVLCGERESTLPPGYRLEDMEKKVPPGKRDDKPKEIPTKPLSTDEALESLSAGFTSSAAPIAKKEEAVVEDVAAIDALSAGFSNFAPPPAPTQKKAEDKAPAAVQSTHLPKSPAPPADKKAKVEKVADDFSLMGAMGSPTKVEEGAEMSLDALSALGDTLGAPEPKPESPKLRPEDIVAEEKLKKEKGVRVGEREDSIPPEYRFKEDKLKDLPPPKKEPSMDAGEALDILSGDFGFPAAAPVVQAPITTPSAPPKQPKVDELMALETLGGDFVAPTKAAAVQAPVGPPTKPPPQKAPHTSPPAPVAPAPAVKTDEGAEMSLDALSALGDTLGAPEPIPEPPKLRPEDIVTEEKLKKEKGVRVGEREDSIPPEYRFKEDKLKDLPPPKKEPSMDAGEALDILSGDFGSPAAAPVVQAPVTIPSAPPTESCSDFALDALVGDLVASAAAPSVQSAATPPVQAERQLSVGTTDALDALSDTLMDTTPVPEPAPVQVKDIVKEKKIVEEKVKKTGERDDTLPPEFQPSEKDIQEMEKAKAKAKADVRPKKKSIDEAAALELLSDDFSAPAPPAAPAASPPKASAAVAGPPTQSAAASAESPKAPGPVLDALSSTLLPSAMESQPKVQSPVSEKPKPKSGKSKSRSKKQAVEDTSAIDNLSGQLGSDVVPTSPTKKSSKS
ncbi:calpastatin isoform X17 [Megalops cyprinoides]|uniref:calpastatin isoform X17 n=1 Tax=Megalops cyprinoides TaxID=118141 RepID=UPI0018643A54|nr:calpastatin isoform X17 [Megalops cyprinoides]